MVTQRERRGYHGSGSVTRKECRWCGKEYVGAKQSKFCSSKCYSASRRRGAMSTCRSPYCSERFRSEKGENGYCSWECYKRDIPRRMEELKATRNTFLEKRARSGVATSDEVDELLRAKQVTSLNAPTERGFIEAILVAVARYEETVPYATGVTAQEVGALLGLRFGERTEKVAPVLNRLESETTFIIRVPREGLARWMLTETGRREVIGNG